MPPKRPFSVTLLLGMVLTLLAWGAVRFFAALRWQGVLIQFDSSLSPAYLSITGAGWGVVGCVLLVGLFTAKTWVRLTIPTSISFWLLEYWVERIFFQSARANLNFAMISTFIGIAITWIAATHPSTKSFFTKSEEHEQPIKNSNPE